MWAAHCDGDYLSAEGDDTSRDLYQGLHFLSRAEAEAALGNHIENCVGDNDRGLVHREYCGVCHELSSNSLHRLSDAGWPVEAPNVAWFEFPDVALANAEQHQPQERANHMISVEHRDTEFAWTPEVVDPASPPDEPAPTNRVYSYSALCVGDNGRFGLADQGLRVEGWREGSSQDSARTWLETEAEARGLYVRHHNTTRCINIGHNERCEIAIHVYPTPLVPEVVPEVVLAEAEPPPPTTVTTAASPPIGDTGPEVSLPLTGPDLDRIEYLEYHVIDAILHYEGGCNDGKIGLLRSLFPTTQARTRVQLEAHIVALTRRVQTLPERGDAFLSSLGLLPQPKRFYFTVEVEAENEEQARAQVANGAEGNVISRQE